jgi:hypothetical protein
MAQDEDQKLLGPIDSIANYLAGAASTVSR